MSRVRDRRRGSRQIANAIAAAALLAALAIAVGAGPASAANTRVSIANYAWSKPQVLVDLDEKVTWDWIGPDLAHSITGISANAAAWDSDAGRDAPLHRAGDSYTLEFKAPGTYLFQCKLHASVRGEVVVSSTPGDPNSDPGPQPPLNVDVKPPTLGSVQVRAQRFRGTKGVRLSAQVSERGMLDAEYYRYNSKGKRVYNGYKTWKAFIGINAVKVGARWEHFKARPGRYEVVLRAIDTANNVSKPVRKRFEILG